MTLVVILVVSSSPQLPLFHNNCHPHLTGWQEECVNMSRYPCQPLAAILTQAICYLINENINYLALVATSISPLLCQPLSTQLLIHFHGVIFVKIKFLTLYYLLAFCIFLIQYLSLFEESSLRGWPSHDFPSSRVSLINIESLLYNTLKCIYIDINKYLKDSLNFCISLDQNQQLF